MRRIIFIDVDDVLANFTRAFLARVNATNGTSFTYKDHQNWDFSCVLPPGQTWRQHISDEEFWATLPLHPWADELMQAIWETGWEYAYLSAIPLGTAFMGRKKWLDEHFQDGTNVAPHKRLIIAERKDFVVGGADSLIEDSPHHIEACRLTGASVLAISHPWNQGIDGLLTPQQVIDEIRAL